MRILIFLLLSATFFTSCGDCACKAGEENVMLIQSIYDDFAAGNIEGVVAKLSSDIEWNEAENYIYADNNPYVGPDAILQGVFARIGAEWTSFNVTNLVVMPVGGDHVLSTGRYQGEHKASGKSMDAQFAHLWGVKDAKASSFQQFTDTKQAAEVVVVAEPIEETSEE